jgi:hypothetical protein
MPPYQITQLISAIRNMPSPADIDTYGCVLGGVCGLV